MMAPDNIVTNRVPGFAVFIGNFIRETVINRIGRIYLDYPGGDVLYAACAYKACGGSAGLIGCIGENFPQKFLNKIQRNGFDISGIKRTNSNLEQRSFYSINENSEILTPFPQKIYSELNLPLPDHLLGYDSSQNIKSLEGSKSISLLSLTEIPERFKKANSIYLSPMDSENFEMASAYCRSSDHKLIFIHPGKEIMQSGTFNKTINVFSGASAVITNPKDLESLFYNKKRDLDRMAQLLGNFGIERIIILMDMEKTYLYDFSVGKKYLIPMLPISPIDPVGSASAFCGGYMAGINAHADAVSAAALGNTMRSLKLGGSTPGYLLQTLPEFIRAKAEYLMDRAIIY